MDFWHTVIILKGLAMLLVLGRILIQGSRNILLFGGKEKRLKKF